MKRVVRILAIIYLSYLALVLLVVTPALNLLPGWAVKKYLGREFNSEIIWFNPFTLSLEVNKTAIPELDGSRFVSLDRASVNLSLESLWSGALVFDRLAVTQLFVHVIENADGTFNFSDMLPPAEPEAAPQESTGIFPVTIHNFNFNSEQLLYTNESREKPFSSELKGLDLNILGLSTVLEEGKPYVLDAQGENGGQLHWEGQVSVPRSHSEGTLSLTDLHVPALWRIVEPWVAFEMPQGRLSVEGHYQVDWSEGVDYGVSQGEVRLDDIAVNPNSTTDLPDTAVSLGSLKLSGIELDGPSQHVGLDTLVIKQLAISGWMEGDQVSLAQLFAVELPGDSSQEAPEEGDGGDDSGWTVSLNTFQLADSSVRWRSEFTEPALLEVTPLEASASDIKWPLEGDSELALNLTVNGETSASAEGILDLALGTGKLSYQLSALPLAWFNPNLPEALNAKVTDGQLQVTGEIALAEYSPTSIGMDGAINGFAGKITDAEESLTSWETVRWEKLRIDMEKHRVEMAKLSIDNYNGRIHIKEDGSINAQNIWQQEVGEQAQEAKEDLSEGEPWSVAIPLIRITDSEVDFMDESLPIHFRTVIGEINGNIKDISTEEGAKTKVDIEGSVDGYAPVTLAGTAQPLRSPPAIDLDLKFAGVDMALLSPYSGTYAGYAIERGVLNLDLKYAMEDNQLKGNNKILIDQMKLGEKVESEKAADLPLELALALLTDSNGVIDMEIPVSGNVDDPQFSVGSVVMGALVNLITKAVTSPFTLLAGLVDSEEDLQRVNFKSGSAELEASASAQLDTLSKALEQRPELNLVIAGRLQLEADRVRLQKNLLQAQLLADGLPEAELSSKGPAWEQAISVRYQAVAPGETTLTANEQYLKLAQDIPLPDATLLELASARAIAVKSYLVNEAGLDPNRAAIAKSHLDADTNRYSGVELQIDI